jgi:hypothetical protein
MTIGLRGMNPDILIEGTFLGEQLLFSYGRFSGGSLSALLQDEGDAEMHIRSFLGPFLEDANIPKYVEDLFLQGVENGLLDRGRYFAAVIVSSFSPNRKAKARIYM